MKTKKIMNNKLFDNWELLLATSFTSFYIALVIYLTVFKTLSFILIFPFLFLFVYFLLNKLNTVSKIKIDLKEDKIIITPQLFYIFLFLIILGGQILYWLAYYPGGFNLDAYGQWDQVHGLQELNNWHPIFTTICYWIVTRIYDDFAFCILVQMIVFSLSIAYLLFVLSQQNISKLWMILIAIFISINPAVGMNNVCLFKDVYFTIALIWMTIILIKIFISKGDWLCSWINLFLFIIDLTVITMIRHNGIFYTISILLCLILLYRKQLKRIIFTSLTYMLCIVFIQGPVFSYFSIEEHSNFTGESVGIPMSIMANSLVSDTENTPDEVEDFLLSIASEKEWKEKYVLGEWDSCKWEFGGTELFQNESLIKIMKLALSTTLSNPNAAYQSLKENTRVVWQVLGPVQWETWVYIEENDYGIYENHNGLCASIVEFILNFSNSFIGTFLCWNIGVPNLIFILLACFFITKKQYQKLIFLLPIIAYNLLTMLLLCGPSHRYFYFNTVLVLPILFFVFLNNKNEYTL